jgi:hypothetical protein
MHPFHPRRRLPAAAPVAPLPAGPVTRPAVALSVAARAAPQPAAGVQSRTRALSTGRPSLCAAPVAGLGSELGAAR